MSHDHDHAAMLASTTLAMNHDHHSMNSSTVVGTHGSPMHDMMMMAMTFHGGYTESILFDQWSTKTVGAFVASWFAVFFLAVLYEALKTLRDYLSKRDFCQQCAQTQTHQQASARLLSFPHAVQSGLHTVQMIMSYGLMLIAMTFNTYLFFAVVLGAGFGHFLFGWRRSSVIDHNEHCH